MARKEVRVRKRIVKAERKEPQGKMVKTDADKLLQLLEERRQLPLDDAARTIHLPAKTLESIATFLEEENMLHITYKFMRPYLNIGPSRLAKESYLPKSEVKGKKDMATVTEKRGNDPKVASPCRHGMDKLLIAAFVASAALTLLLFTMRSEWYYFSFVFSLTIALAAYTKALRP